MEENKIDQIVTGIFEVIPVIMQSKRLVHNKLMESMEQFGAEVRLVEPHIRIMMILKKEKTISMTCLGKFLMISKPNTTTLVDNLVEIDLVERISDPKDRRTVQIQLTTKGNEFIDSYKKRIREETKRGIVNFTDSELDSYIDTLAKMKHFTSKLNNIYDKI
jgi:DNA-binding MarR family transcriptional regulator